MRVSLLFRGAGYSFWQRYWYCHSLPASLKCSIFAILEDCLGRNHRQKTNGHNSANDKRKQSHPQQSIHPQHRQNPWLLLLLDWIDAVTPGTDRHQK